MYKGKENLITAIHLQKGEECIVTGFGQSMTPILKSGQPVRVIPADAVEESKKCILLCANCHRELHDNLWNIEELNKNIEERDS